MSTTTAQRPHLKVKDVVEMTGYSKDAIYKAISAGELRAYRIGTNGTRVRPEDLDAWLDAHVVTAAAR